MLLVAGGVSLALASAKYAEGPLPSKTGAPAVAAAPPEPNCTMCHGAFGGPNNLNDPNGSLAILDLPRYYVPGRTYTLRVRLATSLTSADAARRWGFQLTAVRGFDGSGAGTFDVSGSETPGDTLQIVPGGATDAWPTRSYVEHTLDSIHQGQPDSCLWSFQWTAPAAPAGTIFLFAAGNAANGSQDPTGDWIFTTSDTLTDTTTAVRSLTWGSLKARYR